MKALVYNTNFKNNYNLIEKNRPQILDSKDVILQITLSSICTSDLHIIHGQVPRANNNIVLGHEYVGIVVEVGKDVKKLKIGDRVKIKSGSYIYGTKTKFASFIYSSTLYVRQIDGDKVVVSTQKTGAITGAVSKNDLTKV